MPFTTTIDLLTKASSYIAGCVKTVPGPDGEPDPVNEFNAELHDLACSLAVEAKRLESAVIDPAVIEAMKKEIAALKADRDSWQQQARQRVDDALEFVRQWDAAPASVREAIAREAEHDLANSEVARWIRQIPSTS